jgi:MFS family permease
MLGALDPPGMAGEVAAVSLSSPHSSSAAAFRPDSAAAFVRLGLALLIGSFGSVGMWSFVVVLPTVQTEFGATRAAVSLVYTCAMVGFGIGGVLMGRISDQGGIVRAVGLGTIVMAGGYIGAGYATTLWQLDLMHIAIGIGAAANFGPLMTAVSHWFERYRGVAVSIVASGNYIAGTFWPTLIERGTVYAGWRVTHIAIGVSCAVMMFAGLWVLRRRIGDDRIQSHENAPPPEVDLRMSNNALTALLSIASIACCVAMAMPQVHIVAYCGELGYGVTRGAEMLSLMLACGIISRIGSGFLADRIGGLRTLLVGSIAQGVALLFYVFFDSLASLYLISAMFGLFQGGIVPSYTIIVRESMPAHDAGARVGIIIGASVLGMSLGGWLSGLIFDNTGSYAAAFINGLAWNALNVSIILTLLLRGRPRLIPARA